MSAAAPSLAEIDAAIVKGEWWMTLFDALSDAGMKQVMALKTPKGRGLAGLAEAFCRLALAVRLAIAAAMRLDVLLQGLADLRRLAPEVRIPDHRGHGFHGMVGMISTRRWARFPRKVGAPGKGVMEAGPTV